MLPLASPTDREVGADGGDALGRWRRETCYLTLHEAVLLLRDLDVTDITRSSKGYEEYLTLDMRQGFPFTCKTCDGYSLQERKLFLLSCQ